MSEPSGSWEALDPWDKAAQWHAVSPQVAEELLKLARKRALHRMSLERAQVEHRHRMEIRLWWTQLIGIVGGLACIAGLVLVAWEYSKTGNVGPAVAVFGLGTALTAGVFGLSRAISRQVAQSASPPTGADPAPPTGADPAPVTQ